MPADLFTDANGQPRVLIGCAIGSGSTRLAELAGMVGFDVVWIEMEHASSDIGLAEALCVATEAGGAVPLVRAAGWRREHILQALEIGGRIVVVPMVNDAEMARDVVRYGKFPPLGERGYNTMSRALRYGLDFPEANRRANDVTVLLPQVETAEAAENIDAILAVEGLGGVFIGPGDLSASLGCAGDFDNPELRDLACRCIARARAAGLHAGTFGVTSAYADAALEAGADLCIVTSDLGALVPTWQKRLGEFKK